MRKRMVIAGVVGALCLAATLLLGADLTRSSSSAPGETDALRSRVKELEARVKALEGTVQELNAKVARAIILPKAGTSASPPTFRRVPGAPLPQGKIWGGGECNGWPYYLIPCGDAEPTTGR